MRGGMVVCGCVTGTHLLEDIRVAVPYRVSVTLTAEQVYLSKDLYIALQQNKIFKLKDNYEAPTGAPPPTAAAGVPAKAFQKLQEDNLALQQKLSESADRTAELESAVKGQKGQLDAIQAAIEGLSLTSQVVVTPDGKPVNEAVGGDTPMYLPDISPSEAESRIKVRTQVSEADRVKEAAATLRELRRGKK